jgi:glutathione S-transferase
MSEALLTCGVCGIGFRGRSDARYCSSACRQKAHRDRTARRIAGLAEQRQSGAGAARAIIKPDVAGAIKRAADERRRARALCRTSAAILDRRLALQRLAAGERPTPVGAPASTAPWSGWSVLGPSVGSPE